MKNVYAGLDNLSTIFTDEYVIPDSHPYSWTEEDCQKIWDEIISLHEGISAGIKSDKKHYPNYLGRLCLHTSGGTFDYTVKNIGGSVEWNILDGANEIRAMAILIKALYDKDTSNKGLEFMLYKKNVIKNTSIMPKVPVVSVQIAQENQVLQKVLLGESSAANAVNATNRLGELKNGDKVHQSYHCFSRLIDERAKAQKVPTIDVASLAETLLTKVVMLVVKRAAKDKAAELLDTSAAQSPPVVAKQIFRIGIGLSAPRDDSGREDGGQDGGREDSREGGGHQRELITFNRDLVDQGIYFRTVLFMVKPKNMIRNFMRSLIRVLFRSNSSQ